MNLSTKQKQTQRHREESCGYQEGREAGVKWIGSLQLTDVNYIYTMDKQQDPTVQHRDYIQYTVINNNGKDNDKLCVCVCVYIYIYIYLTESLFCTIEIDTTL